MTLFDRLRDALDRPAPDRLIAGDLDDADEVPASRDAAVLVPVTQRPEPGVILTQRTGHLRTHAGQVAFPGGRIDPEDDGPVAAALREAYEEVALPPDAVTVVGIADRYRTGSGYTITPVVGIVAPDRPLVANPAEVEAVFEVPLAFLLDAANHARGSALWRGRERHFYDIRFGDRRIWGATAAILVNLSRRLQWTS